MLHMLCITACNIVEIHVLQSSAGSCEHGSRIPKRGYLGFQGARDDTAEGGSPNDCRCADTQILKVIRVHGLRATTPSLHVHIWLYSCAPFTMTFRVGSRAEANFCSQVYTTA